MSGGFASESRATRTAVRPDAEAAPASGDEDETLDWHRFSRRDFVRVALKALLAPFALAWVAFQNLVDAAEDRGVRESIGLIADAYDRRFLLAGTFGLIVLALAVVGVEWLAWRRASYALGTHAVHCRRGWLKRSCEDLPYARIQTVETERSLLDRLLGLGTVKVDTGADSTEALSLGRLRIAECHRIRVALLDLSARARDGSLSGHADTDTDGVATSHNDRADNERHIYRIRPRDLVLARLLSGGSLAGALVALSGAAGACFTDGISLVAVVFGILGAAKDVGSSLARQWDTRLSVAPAGVRMRAGLTTTTTRTITPSRVHLIEIRQSLAMRLLGRYSLSVTYPGMDSEEGGLDIDLVPLGRREDVEWVLWVFAHDMGVPEPARLVEQFLGDLARMNREDLGAVGGVRFFASVSPRVRCLHPFAWRWGALACTDEVAMTRTRTPFSTCWAVLFHEHWQSVACSASPVSRWLGVADVRFALASGRLALGNLAAADADRAVGVALRLSAARRAAGDAESIGLWRGRVGVGGGPVAVGVGA